jgi:4-diphosphocytidyl-2-C-methyl-D-erythritol kinase
LTTLERLAPAKVNLFLHVGAIEADGYHPIASLMVFADIGDRLSLTASEAMSFGITGPFAGQLGEGGDNLVPRARDLVLEALGGASAPFRLTLDKQLPVAAGLGGGSADAAATFNLVAEALARGGSGGVDHDQLEAMARTLGADVAACLGSRAVIATGRGDRLTPAPAMSPIHAVLANPGAPSSTRAVYAAFDETAHEARADLPGLPGDFPTTAALASFLRATRNDLETLAVAMAPVIGAVLTAFRSERETLLARMSGSGATCFSLCGSRQAAVRLADRLAAAHPRWWVRACRLGSVGAAEKV